MALLLFGCSTRGRLTELDPESSMASPMHDPITALVPVFSATVTRVLGAEHAGVDPMLRPSKHADFQANLAMSLGKTLGRNPRELAQALIDALPANPWLERAAVAGPGFINLWLSSERLAAATSELLGGDLGLLGTASERVVVDYSSPNVAKEMHVGHLRSTIIGDALARVFEALGHTVIRQNHIGDWGTPFGMLIEHLLDLGEETARQSVSDLGAFYREARQKFDADPAFAERARRRVVALQGGDPKTLRLWETLVNLSKSYFETIYHLLGVTLTEQDIAGESLYNRFLPEVVVELAEKGLARDDQGAVCAFPPGFQGRDEQPLPLIIKKQDGGYGYATTDLAALRYRVRELKATRVLYVVGAPQAQHLSMVFAVARLANWLPGAITAEHVPFGSVLGTDGKIFRTRAGETVRLVDLLNEAVKKARAIVEEKNPELSDSEKDEVAQKVGIGAVKYADLSSDRVKDYVFDWERMLAFQGNTAPYLQYALARIRSILRRRETHDPMCPLALTTPEEKALALCLLGFGGVVREVAATLSPHKLCSYLFELSTTYNAFYDHCPVLKAETTEKCESRLALCQATALVLERGLGLLGIDAPARM